MIANEVDKLPSKSEHETQTRIINLIRDRGGVVTRINSGSMIAKSADGRTYRVQLADKGTSDIIALYKGVYLAIEVKFGKGKATDEQIEFLESVAKAGGVGLVAYSLEYVERILNCISWNEYHYEIMDSLRKFNNDMNNNGGDWMPNRLFVGGE